MIEVLILAVALSMDAFAVSIGLGSKHERKTRTLAVQAAIYFGLFQALMPLIGFFGGKGVSGWVEAYAHWNVQCGMATYNKAKQLIVALRAPYSCLRRYVLRSSH
jgi:putative Mn2+ efflux pump MntP